MSRGQGSRGPLRRVVGVLSVPKRRRTWYRKVLLECGHIQAQSDNGDYRRGDRSVKWGERTHCIACLRLEQAEEI